MTDSTIILDARGITKRYIGVQALNRIDFTLHRGEIACLVGENGSGKSTLVKILAGIEPMDAGELCIDGKSFTSYHNRAAIDCGIQVIYQDLSLFEQMTVAENIAMNRYIKEKKRFIREKETKRIAADALAMLGITLPLDAPVQELSMANKQLIAICRSLASDARILFMDEPTTALTKKEIIAAYCIVVTCINPRFFTLETLFSICKSASGTLILACGVLVIMISGGIYVSFTYIALFSGYTVLTLAVRFGIDNLFVLFLLAGVIGTALGLVNALLVNLLRLDPFIITLGTSSLFHGIMTIFIGLDTIGASLYPPSLKAFGLQKFFTSTTAEGAVIGLPASFLPAVLILLATWFLLKKTRLGRGVYAVGCSRYAADRAGFKVSLIRFFVFGYSGLLAGLMGIIHLANVGTCSPIAIIGDELSIIAAVVIGGASVSGGRGSVVGTVLGVFIMWLFNSTLIYIGLSSSWSDFFVGCIMLAVVIITSYQERLKNRKAFIFTE